MNVPWTQLQLQNTTTVHHVLVWLSNGLYCQTGRQLQLTSNSIWAKGGFQDSNLLRTTRKHLVSLLILLTRYRLWVGHYLSVGGVLTILHLHRELTQWRSLQTVLLTYHPIYSRNLGTREILENTTATRTTEQS